MKIAAVLLAAGRSSRFGAADKLATPLHGIPLGLHAARTLSLLPLDPRIVVAGATPLDWGSFTIVPNDAPDRGMAHSLGLGLAAARGAGAQAILVALADMPFVSAAHFERLIASERGAETLVASSDGQRRSPPALFGARWFPELAALSGDRGARALLERAQLIEAPTSQLADIDSPADLAAAGP